MNSYQTLPYVFFCFITCILLNACNDLGDHQDLSSPNELCNMVNCAGRTCTVIDGVAMCICPLNSYDDGTGRCVKTNLNSDEDSIDHTHSDMTLPSNPCHEYPCSDNQVCSLIENQASCICNAGLIMDETSGDCIIPMEDPDLCTPNPCTETGRSICAVFDEQVMCTCDPGLIEDSDGNGCVTDHMNTEDADLCQPNPCQEEHRGLCLEVDLQAVCQCDEGYQEIEGRCERFSEETFTCEDIQCEMLGRSRCEMIGDEPTCVCDVGWVEDEMSDMCVPEDPCVPNPCQEEYRGVCLEVDLQAVCICDEGYIEDMQTGVCMAIRTGMCENRHLDGDVYEPNECHLEASITSFTTVQQHSIMPADDEDWFRLDAIPHHIYHFSIEKESLPNAIIYLYEGESLRLITSHSSASSITYEMPTQGPYFYRVHAYNSRQTGTYSVSITDLGLDDHADQAIGATPIQVGDVHIQGDIETGGDDDWFSFRANEGRIYQFELIRDTLSDAYVYLYRPDGQIIAESHSTPESITYEVDEGGMWYIRIRHTSSISMGTYTLMLHDMGVDDHSDEPFNATLISSDGIALVGDIETRGDVDYFAFEAQASHIYQVTLTPLGLGNGYMRVYGPNNQRYVNTNDDSFIYKAIQNETWHLEIKHANSIGMGDYLISIQDLGVDDHADESQSATLINLNDEVTGVLESNGDLDYFTFDAQAHHIYQVDVVNTDVSYSKLEFYGLDGETMLTSSNQGSLRYEVGDAGRYFVQMSHYLSIGRGQYTLQISELGLDDHVDHFMEASPFVNDMMSGVIETVGDIDYFMLPLNGGQVYQLRRSGISVYMTLYAQDGITELTSTGLSEMNINIEQTGNYFIKVRSTIRSMTGGYTLLLVD